MTKTTITQRTYVKHKDDRIWRLTGGWNNTVPQESERDGTYGDTIRECRVSYPPPDLRYEIDIWK